ncbi:MAG: hypothetical protein ACI8QG_003046, partial [Flavobacteriales bacterium]
SNSNDLIGEKQIIATLKWYVVIMSFYLLPPQHS